MLRPLLFLALVLPVSAQETIIRQEYDPVTDTHVEIVALFSKPSPGGYLPVRVKIANNLKTDRSIQLSFDSGSNYTQGNHTASSFGFTADAGKTITQDILVPLSPTTGSYSWGANLTTHLGGSLGNADYVLNGIPDNSQPAVLLSEVLFTPNASSLDAATSSSGSSGGRTEFAAKFDPKQLPDNWLAFSGYDSVIMTDNDWSNMPSGGRNALLSWLRLGGQLVIYATGSADAKSLGIPEEASYGSVSINRIASDLKLNPADTIALVGKNPNKPRIATIKSDYDGSWPLQAYFGSQTFRYGLFIAVLIVFAVVVGPVNLFVFAKSGQRHKLFITTPLISLAASLLLIGLIVIQDGFGGSGIRRVLMEVRPDGDQNAAYLHQEQFCRTGVLTGSRFTITEPAVFSPVPIASSRWARFTNSSTSRGSFNLQPSDGKFNASGDWFQSRSEHGHILSALIPTRGRIERTSEARTLLSTFEFPIETLFFLDNDGQWYRADAITTGKRFSLTPVDLTMVQPAVQKEISGFANRNGTMLLRAWKRPGCYFAITRDAPGIGTHPGIRWKETRTVITGPVLAP